MAVKFNKEMLLKHRFWVMLGAQRSLLALGGIGYLELFVSADDQAARNSLPPSKVGRERPCTGQRQRS